MTNLNNISAIKKLDKGRMYESIELLGQQCEQAWQEVKKIKIPKSFSKNNNLIFFGMGGSALGPEITKYLFLDSMKKPVEIIRDYSTPNFVDQNTLVFLVSYSGNTEETLQSAKESIRRTKKIIVITAGGDLEKFAFKNHLPIYLIDPINNPCGQPRMALGYMVMGVIGLLKNLGLVKIDEQEVKKAIAELAKLNDKFGLKINTSNNLAKKIAQKIYQKMPIFVASKHLLGNVHTAANQTNENGKNFSAFFTLPDLNHHLLEGLAHPKQGKNFLHFVFFNSKFYNPRTQARYKITQKIVKQNGVGFSEINLGGQTKLIQSFEALSFSSYLSYYLALLNNLDPSPVPWVDYFKEQLSRFK